MINFDSAACLRDDVLVRRLSEVASRYHATTVELLPLIAEVDERKLYLPEAYSSMFRYCVDELKLPEDTAYRYITAARAARRFPILFEALAGGRLHLTAVTLLAPHLTVSNANELVRAAEHKSKSEIEQLLAERFPQSEMLALVETLPSSSGDGEGLAPERVGTHDSPRSELVPGRVEAVAPRSNVKPHASGRFALHAIIGTSAHNDLRRAQELLGHQLLSGDVGAVIERALRLLVVKLESAKLAATSRPQRNSRPTTSARHIPAHVKRAVRERDGDRCTFVSESGRRCASRTMLEFDHIDAVARGGEATLGNVRLRCRPHNQLTAECTFGREFMDRKREEARHAADSSSAARDTGATVASTTRATVATATLVPAAVTTPATGPAEDLDVVPWLRSLGFRAPDARRAAEHCERIPHARLEERVRVAISFLGRT